jgi:hypothetical protein
MDAKYNAAIKAGVIGGILLSGYVVLQFLLNVVNTLVTVPGMNMFILACGCLWWAALIILGAGTGAMAVNFASRVVTKLTDGLIVAAIAGAIAGLIYVVMAVVIGFITPLLNIVPYLSTSDLGVMLGGSVGIAAAAGIAVCICAPLWVVIIVILAVIGGAIWGALKLKLT